MARTPSRAKASVSESIVGVAMKASAARQVAADAGVGGPAARQDRRMPGSGLRDRMVLVGVAEGGASLQQRGERALELRPVALEVVRPQLVDGDHDDQPGA